MPLPATPFARGNSNTLLGAEEKFGADERKRDRAWALREFLFPLFFNLMLRMLYAFSVRVGNALRNDAECIGRKWLKKKEEKKKLPEWSVSAGESGTPFSRSP